MSKRLLLIATLMFALGLNLHADAANNHNGLFVWVNGTSTCYKLSDMPTVTYSNGSAILTLKGSAEPVLTLELKNGAKLEMAYGEYNPTAIKDVKNTSIVTKKGKFIQGGKLIIIKDGKKFDANGIELK